MVELQLKIVKKLLVENHNDKSISNNLLGGMETTTTTYSFTGQPLTVTHIHTATGKTSRTEVYTYTYDHADRLSTVKHKLGSGTEVTLASYTYDNKGRMATKRLHGSSTNTLTYSYNIRSWLTGISSTKFTQTLGYGSHYNGNISSMNWTANGTSHAYTFTYDGVNRMLNATHGTGAYTEKVTSYDKNGNIKALQRYGNGLIDNLTYTYSGNQLTKVEDATGNTAGFNNGASTANEYVYDNNGNLTKDSNKGITSIAYNCLNLPSTVTFSDGSTIVYSYAADGTKLRTVHTISGTTTQKDYCANVVYENGVQKMLLTEEGYVDLSVTSPAYYYYLKDHQGNNRVVVSSGGTVAEVSHYYPFGGVFASSSNVQPYKYNGKELDTKKGLNWYDYGARHYDATLGRWLAVDPLAEKMYGWSPYAYCFNSPVRYIDPDGEIGQVAAGAIVGGLIGGGWALLQGKSFGEVAAATIGGAIDGAITATGIGLMGKIATGVIGGGLGNAIEQGIYVATDNQSSINSTELVVSSMFGVIGGRASHQIDNVASKMIQTVDEKYATSATKNAIMKEVKSEMIEKGRELGHSTKQTINKMTRQRIDVLSNMDKIFIKGGANTIDVGIGITNTIVNTEIMNWIDKKE